MKTLRRCYTKFIEAMLAISMSHALPLYVFRSISVPKEKTSLRVYPLDHFIITPFYPT